MLPHYATQLPPINIIVNKHINLLTDCPNVEWVLTGNNCKYPTPIVLFNCLIAFYCFCLLIMFALITYVCLEQFKIAYKSLWLCCEIGCLYNGKYCWWSHFTVYAGIKRKWITVAVSFSHTRYVLSVSLRLSVQLLRLYGLCLASARTSGFCLSGSCLSAYLLNCLASLEKIFYPVMRNLLSLLWEKLLPRLWDIF